MSFSLATFYLLRKRLILAMAGAVLAHVFLFSSGYLVLSSFVIPSDASRVLMLTLNSSPLDGIPEQAVEDSETLNNTPVATAKSIPNPAPADPTLPLNKDPIEEELIEQAIVSETLSSDVPVTQVDEPVTQEAPEDIAITAVEDSSITAVEDSSITPVEDSSITAVEDSSITPVDDSYITPVDDSSITPVDDSSITSAESAINDALQDSLQEITPQPELASESYAISESSAEPSLETTEQTIFDTVNAGLIAETIEQVSILIAPESEVAAPSLAATPKPEIISAIVVTKTQQKMLERKIGQFAKKLVQGNTAQSLSWQHKGQTYIARFKRLPAADNMEMDEIEVAVSTEQDGRKLSKKMRMKKLAFSNFAQFVHEWDTEISLHDDELDGRFHSNSKIHLSTNRDAAPIFFGKVTTASHTVDLERTSRRSAKKNIFLGGLETGVKKIRMPQPRLLYGDKRLTANDKTILFTQDTRIVFTVDGRYSAQSLKTPISAKATTESAKATTDIVKTSIVETNIGDAPVFMLAAPDVTLHIGGTVKGKVLIYSPRGIVIETSLIYANSGSVEPHNNFLGLVSDRDIVIADAEITGPGDLQIDASIYAKRRFKVNKHTAKHTGTLKILGSLTAGTISATEPRYATKITFDKRLENLRPPGYPVSDRYELALSEHDWEVETIQPNPDLILD